MMALLKKRLNRLFVLAGCSATLVACEAMTTGPELMKPEPQKQALVGKVTAGIRPMANELNSEQAMELVFYLSNGSSNSIDVLPWATPLEDILSADIFVVNKNGEKLPYGGRMIKRAAPSAEDYMTIAGGEQLESVVNLSRAYDVKGSGAYKIVLESLSLQNSDGSFVEPVIVDSTVAVTRK